jgi:CRP/FNR family transcriptional regulator, cyclic AMP receptor protein
MPPPHGAIPVQDHVETGCRVTPTLRVKETIIMIQTLELVIKEHPFFYGLSDEHLDFITGCAKNVAFPEKHVMFTEGDPANEFYFIRKGLVSVELMVQNTGPTTVQTLGGGEILGWSWVSPPYHWHFNARTLKPTRALVFDANCLRAKCEEDHDLGYEMLKRFSNIITARLDATRLQLLDIYTNKA